MKSRQRHTLVHTSPTVQWRTTPWTVKQRTGNARQEGTLWQRRMRTLALRLSEGQVRRDRSGAPMRRGS
jgi:hypothetical protein